MSATLKELRDQIVIDSGISGHVLFPAPRLNRMINLAQRYVQTNLNGLGMKKWETSDSLTLTSAGTFGGGGVKKSSLSSDCPNMLESPNSIMFIATSDGTTEGIAYEIDTKDFQEQLNNTYFSPTVSKPIFMRLANNIYLAPVDITSATAYYYKSITDLSSDSSTTEIPMEFEEFIIKKVVLEISEIQGKLQEKELAQAQLDKDLQTAYQKYIGKQAETKRVKKEDEAKLQ